MSYLPKIIMDPTQPEKVADPFALPASRRKALRTLAALAGAGVVSARPIATNILGLNFGTTPALAKDVQGVSVAGETKLTGELVFPNNPAYQSARLGFARQFSEFPIVIAFCCDVQDVVNDLSWCRKHQIPFRARSGGRHSVEGWSNLNGGVVIDTSHMKQLHINARAGVATVQAGATQGEILDALGQAGYTIPGGDQPSVGIAGLTLGGGIGYLSRTLGPTCDSLIGVEMVIAAGKSGAQVIRADERNNADLLWASRGGGGGNFGIATSFTFKIYPMPNVAVYVAKWNWQYLTEVFRAWQELAPSAVDGLASVYFAKAKANGEIESYGTYLGSENQLRQLLQPLLKIGRPDVTFKTMSYLDAFHYLANLHPSMPGKIKFSSAWAYSPFPPEGIQTVRNFLTDAPKDANTVCLSWGGAVGRVPTGATAFFHRKAQFFVDWASSWQTNSGGERSVAWVEQYRKALQPYVIGSYVNIPDRFIGNWLSAYYGSNVARLREVKSKYDPYNVFNFEQSIPPAR